MKSLSLAIAIAIALVLSLTPAATAHPMGNFSVNQISFIVLTKATIQVNYILDLAEIPTFQMFAKKNVEEEVSRLADECLSKLSMKFAGADVPLRLKQVRSREDPGEGGLPTIRIVMSLEAPWQLKAGAIDYADSNFPERMGWKNIVIEADDSVYFPAGNGYPMDKTHGLSEYPTDALTNIPNVRRAVLNVAPNTGAGILTGTVKSAMDLLMAPRDSKNSAGSDSMSRMLRSSELPVNVVLLGFAMAFSLGALHALSPGHGKTIVAAYLVGNRGTAKHAVFLGTVVTFTHTVGVFALGVLTLFASRYVVPEKLYPWMGLGSGLMIVAIGLGLFRQRLRRFRKLEDGEGEVHSHGAVEHSHSNARGVHSHEIPDQLTMKSLVTLGISGGIVPCPSALVVLLTAVAMHRIGLGLLLIVAFSIGLAGVLVMIGLLVVRAKSYLGRFQRDGIFTTALPVFSAILITIIGLGVSAQSIQGLIP